MGHEIRVLTEAELRVAVPLDIAAVEVVEKAFVALASGGVIMPPIMSMELPGAHDEVDVKTAFIPGFDGFAVKVSTGFYGNAALGLPSLNGLMVLFSAQTGRVEAVLLDNGYLTDVRTAAAGAVAAKHLAPSEVACAGVLGTGLQARLQLRAAHMVRPLGRALVWGRDEAKARACAADLAAALGIDVHVERDPARLTAESQLVITTTPAREAILRADWLHPGLHVTAMGSDAPEKNEIDPAALAAADLYVADRVSQCVRLGELRSAVAAGLMRADDVAELGQIVTGARPGRASTDAVTICDLTGTGAQDTAIATHALAVAGGAGIRIEV
jgi:ornithine cyclodeaminase